MNNRPESTPPATAKPAELGPVTPDRAQPTPGRRAFAVVVTAVLMLTAICLPVRRTATAAEQGAGGDSHTSPVLVELFTSQGCSSCPPADRLLSALAATDDGVVALAFHVDYWNSIGWTDPFSSADWSDRQRDYARALGAQSIYTPQLVVNGRRHAVGSNQREVAAMIRQAAHDESSVRLAVEVSSMETDSLELRLDARLADGAKRDLDAWVALVEDGLETPVGRGENARRTLRNDRVVRRLIRAGRIARSGPTRTVTVDLDLDPAWHPERLSVVAFLQDPRSLHVVASAAAAIP